MKKYLFILIGLLSIWIISGALHSTSHFSQSEAACNLIVGKINKKLAKKYELSTVGVGGGETKEGIWLISVSFDRLQGPLPKNVGRKMIVDCIEEYLSGINSYEKIRPFLKNYPFTPENLEIIIINSQPDNSNIYDPDIEVFSSARGKIFYDTRDPEDFFKYKSKTYESYEEALAIVRKEQQQALIDREI